MKNLIKSFLFTMTFLVIICKPGVASTFATPNIELQGNANGIVFIQGDEPFLWSDNMLPGDKFERSILLNNKYDNSYKIFMRAERVSKKEDYDLLEKTKLKVLYDGNCIYDGAISGQNGLENNIYLGSVEPGECKKLEAFAEFPGSELGNEYKNKKGQVDWIFTAVRVGDEDNENISGGKEINEGNIGSNKNNIKDIIKKIIVPKTGDSSLILYFIIFSLCSIVLLALNNNFIKNKIKIFKKEE
ncbi:TPA: LPXTG cell wall anchor domain-containing protein [Clostridium perfringens]|nr:LPXTG cell wall anchor domain-containing protein [Clostridium perfringens]HAT4345204.1 LPXTG cell wall anchor domain-containing protein [Clostridium perfringens]